MGEALHGTDCACGVGVDGPTRLLDTACLAEHLGVSVGTIDSHRSRARAFQGSELPKTQAGRLLAPVPTWWRNPDGQFGGSWFWLWETAEAMRVARTN